MASVRSNSIPAAEEQSWERCVDPVSFRHYASEPRNVVVNITTSAVRVGNRGPDASIDVRRMFRRAHQQRRGGHGGTRAVCPTSRLGRPALHPTRCSAAGACIAQRCAPTCWRVVTVKASLVSPQPRDQPVPHLLLIRHVTRQIPRQKSFLVDQSPDQRRHDRCDDQHAPPRTERDRDAEKHDQGA